MKPTNEDSPSVAWPLVTTLGWGLVGMLSFAMALFVPMLFDAPGSTENRTTVTLALATLALPVTCGLALLLSWWGYLRRRRRMLLVAALLPLLPLLVVLLAFVALEVFHDGRFGG